MYFKNSIMALIVIFAIIFGTKTFFSNLIHFNYNDNLTVSERIAPLGQVYLSNDVIKETVKASTKAKARSGKDVYTAVCASCHSVGILNAPKFGNKTDWAQRVKRGIASLVKVAISGTGAMPPKGTCMDCSDDELQAAIEYMIK
jgi:cytochrome c5